MISQLDRIYVAIYWLCTRENLRICFLMRKIWILLQPRTKDFWGSLACISWLGGEKARTLSGDLNVIHLSWCHWIPEIWNLKMWFYQSHAYKLSDLAYLYWALTMLFKMGMKTTVCRRETELVWAPMILSPSRARIWIKIFWPWEKLRELLVNYSCFFKAK